MSIGFLVHSLVLVLAWRDAPFLAHCWKSRGSPVLAVMETVRSETHPSVEGFLGAPGDMSWRGHTVNCQSVSTEVAAISTEVDVKSL